MRGDRVAVGEVLDADRDEDVLPRDRVAAHLRETVEVVADLVVAHGVREEVVDAAKARLGRERARLANLAVAAERKRAHGLAGDRAELGVLRDRGGGEGRQGREGRRRRGRGGGGGGSRGVGERGRGGGRRPLPLVVIILRAGGSTARGGEEGEELLRDGVHEALAEAAAGARGALRRVGPRRGGRAARGGAPRGLVRDDAKHRRASSRDGRQ